MTDAAASPQHVDDAKLLNLVRAGDGSAFGVLYLRHEKAARRLARDLVVSPAEVDEVVAETFARVLAVLRVGGGPSDGFRAYVLTALRRMCDDRLSGQQSKLPDDVLQLPDPGAPFTEPGVAGPDNSLILGAFLSLPERWAAVLWHTEIERATPAEVTPFFGLSRNGVAALSRRAKDGLRQAYLQMHVARITRQECRPVAERLGAFVRDALSGRDTAMVSEHLDRCSDCRAVCDELSDLNAALRDQVAPAFLGTAAASYLSLADGDAAAGSATGSDVAVPGHHAAEPRGLATRTSVWRGTGGRRISGSWLMHASGQQRLLAAGAAVVLAAIALGAYEISLPANTTSAPPPGHQGAAGSRGSIRVIGQPARPHKSVTPKPRPTATPTHTTPSAAATTSQPAVSPTPNATASRPASPSPRPRASPSRKPDVKLAASVDVYGQGGPAWVVFRVTDTGKGATGGLTATIVLPPGSSFAADGSHWHHGPHSWTCQATSSGASCHHAGISAGGQAEGALLIQVSGSSACGQPVQLTVTSGTKSASAQSPETIQCGGGGGD